jgi:hypothetical protein
MLLPPLPHILLRLVETLSCTLVAQIGLQLRHIHALRRFGLHQRRPFLKIVNRLFV